MKALRSVNSQLRKQIVKLEEKATAQNTARKEAQHFEEVQSNIIVSVRVF